MAAMLPTPVAAWFAAPSQQALFTPTTHIYIYRTHTHTKSLVTTYFTQHTLSIYITVIMQKRMRKWRGYIDIGTKYKSNDCLVSPFLQPDHSGPKKHTGNNSLSLSLYSTQ